MAKAREEQSIGHWPRVGREIGISSSGPAQTLSPEKINRFSSLHLTFSDDALALIICNHCANGNK